MLARDDWISLWWQDEWFWSKPILLFWMSGAAMGLYSLTGFAGGLAGPVLFGAALDIAGGAAARVAWIAGYAAIGAGCLAAPIVARIGTHRHPS